MVSVNFGIELGGQCQVWDTLQWSVSFFNEALLANQTIAELWDGRLRGDIGLV